MAGTITNGFCDSAKGELASGGHNFMATQTSVSCSGTSGQFTLTGIAAATMALISIGMAVTGTGIGAGAVVSSIQATGVTLSVSNGGTVTAATFMADSFKMLLLKSASAIGQNYSRTLTNIGTLGSGTLSTTNIGADEVTGTNYTSGGLGLTNTSPTVVSGSGTYWTFNNPSWTTATFTAGGAVIYNTSIRIGHVNGITANASGSAYGRTISVHSFGGDQTVTAGTFTVVMPTPAIGTAILQIT